MPKRDRAIAGTLEERLSRDVSFAMRRRIARVPSNGSKKRRNSYMFVRTKLIILIKVVYRESVPDHLSIHELVAYVSFDESARGH